MINRLVTMGLGPSRGEPGRAGVVTSGFGGPPTFVVEALGRRVPRGRSALGKVKRPDLHTVIVWAKLVEVNSRKPEVSIEGSVTVSVDPSAPMKVVVKEVASRLISAVKVTVRRLKP